MLSVMLVGNIEENVVSEITMNFIRVIHDVMQTPGGDP